MNGCNALMLVRGLVCAAVISTVPNLRAQDEVPANTYPANVAAPQQFVPVGYAQAAPNGYWAEVGSAPGATIDAVPDVAGVHDRLRQMEQRLNQLEGELAAERADNGQANAAAWQAPVTAGAQQVNYELLNPGAPNAAAAPAKKYPTVQINGVFQADTGFFSQDANSLATYGQIQDGADFRRARLSAKGAVLEQMNYFLQLDFAAFGRPTFTDVWVEQTKIPCLGNVRIGQWKQPFSLEVVSSFRYTTFMERSVLFQPFTPFRHIGTGFYDHNEELSATWAASVFRTGQDQFGGSISTDGGWGTAERVTWLPYWDAACNGSSYLHLGAGHFFSNPPNDSINFRTIPEFYVGENAPGVVGTSGQAAPGAFNGTPFFVATGSLAVEQYNVIGSELLWVNGPWSLQSEAMVNFVRELNGNDATLPGVYAQVGYFLTGEHRPYDRANGAIDRVIPFRNFVHCPDGCSGGCGAWEVAARFSYIDLNDQNIAGGTLTDFTLGVNWYLNPYAKLVFNYIHARPDLPVAGESVTDIFGLRAQVDF